MLLFILFPAPVLFSCHGGVVVWERWPRECPFGDSSAGVQGAAAVLRQSRAGLKLCLGLAFTEDLRDDQSGPDVLLQSHFQQRTACLSLLSCIASLLFWAFFFVAEFCLRQLMVFSTLLGAVADTLFGVDVLVLLLVSAPQLLFASLWQSRSSGFVSVVIKDSPSQCGSSVPLFLCVFLPRAPSGLYIYYCFHTGLQSLHAGSCFLVMVNEFL